LLKKELLGDRTKKDRIMKSNVIVVFLLCIVTASQPAFTAVRGKPIDVEPPLVAMASASADNADPLGDLLVITPVVPRGPRDVLRGYELEMASIAGRLSMNLGTISKAVGTGQITRLESKGNTSAVNSTRLR
jgi:hypothetical protein